MKKIVVLTGAGISAESGISTFRDSNGLWENYNVQEVASIEGWYQNPQLIQKFYNERRAQLAIVEPNRAHILLAELEKDFDVTIITQNIDNLHERAGSHKIIHLHGELTKACSSADKESYIEEIGYRPIANTEKAPDGSPLRPYIVWFGEAVPAMDMAIKAAKQADIFVIIGTSMNVYPAAGLVNYAPHSAPIYLIDPKEVNSHIKCKFIQQPASLGVKILAEKLKKLYL